MTASDIERERKFVSILFADLSGYTSMSEQMDPETLTDIVGECLNRLGQVVYHYDGYIDKFMGDAVMALFGAPLSHENDPERSIACALHMLRELESFNREKSLDLKMSIGINSGIVIAGSIGTEGKMDYTVMGDAVNVAQRVQTIAKPGQVLVTKTIVNAADKSFDFIGLPSVTVKGKSTPIEIFEARSARSLDDSRETLHRSYSKLFGRTRELSQIQQMLEHLKDSSAAALIVGEAGSGKTRLIHELKKLTLPMGVRWLSSSTSGVAKDRPYGALIRVLQSILDEVNWEELSLDPIDENLLRALLNATPTKDEGIANPEERKRGHFGAIRNVFNQFVKSHRAVIAFEDGHWMDPLSREFVTDYVAHLPAKNLLILLSTRTEGLEPWSTAPFMKTIALRPLDDDSAAALACYLLKLPKLPPHLSAALVSKGEGNPLYIEEFLKTLIDTQQIQFKDDRWTIPEQLNLNEIPQNLRALIASRIDRLSKECKSVLQVASVIGREFDDSLLENSGLLCFDIQTCLRVLRKKELIFEYDVSDNRITYVFKHALTRDVAYDTLLQKRRRECHAVIGTTLERSTDPLNNRLEVLAYHFLNGGIKAKAIDYLQICASKDAENFDNERAIAYFREALRIVESDTQRLPEIQNKVFELQNQAAWTLYGMGRLDEAESLMLKQVDLAKRDSQFSLLAQAYRRLGEFYRYRGEPEMAETFLQESMLIADEHNDLRQRVRTLKELGNIEKLKRNFDRSLEYLEQGMANVEALRDPKLEAAFWNDIGEVHILKGDLERATQTLNLCISLCQMMGTRSDTYVAALNNLGVICWYQKKYEQSLEYFQQSSDLAKEMGSTSESLKGLLNATEVLLKLSHVDGALRAAEQCIRWAQTLADAKRLRRALLLKSQALLETNQTEKAKPLLETARAEARSTSSWDHYVEASLHLSKALENQGNEEGMRDLLYETQSTLKLHKLTDLEAKVEEYRQSSLKQKNTKGK